MPLFVCIHFINETFSWGVVQVKILLVLFSLPRSVFPEGLTEGPGILHSTLNDKIFSFQKPNTNLPPAIIPKFLKFCNLALASPFYPLRVGGICLYV